MNILSDIFRWVIEHVEVIGTVVAALVSLGFWYFRQFMSEMKDPDALRKYRVDLSRRSRWQDAYQQRLRAGLDWTNRFFGEGLLGAQAFARCWNIALVYPVVLFLLSWGFTGRHTIGEWAVLPEGWGGLARAGLIVVFGLYGYGLYGLFKKDEEVARWVRRFLDRLVKVRLLARFRPKTRGYILSGVLGLVAGIGGYLATGSIAFAFNGPFLFALLFAVAFNGAVAFNAVAVAVGFAGAVAVAFVGAVTVAGALAVAFNGAVLGAFLAVLVAFVRAVTVVVVGAFAFAFAGVLGVLFPPFPGTDEGVVISALFLGLLPLFNAMLDWLSWGISRRLGRSLRDHYHKYRAFAWWLFDFLVAAMLLVSLVFVLSFALEGLNTLRGEVLVDLDGLIAQVRDDPWGEGLWITVMLLSTLLPTTLHFTFVMFSWIAMPLSPARRRQWLDEIDAVLSSDDEDKALNPRTRRNIAEYLMLHRLAVLFLTGVAALVVVGLVAYSLGLLPGIGSITEGLVRVAEAGRRLAR